MKKLLFMALSLALTAPVMAQDDDDVEEIVVTGSRIARNTFATPSPVTVLDAEAIEVSGSTNIGDLLNELPALGSTFGTQNSDRFIGTAGLNLLDLRRLGDERTLVLVNGQRHVAGSIGSAAVDVNSIPSALIERVEIVTGGASAIYGADAVTGVVNFVLKDSFNGIALDVQSGQSESGSLERQSVDLVAGSDFAGGRGNAVFAMEFSRSSSLSARERGLPPIRLVNNPLDGDTTDANGNIVNDGIPDEIVTANAGLSIITNGGYFSAAGNNYVFDAPGSFRLHNPGTNFGSSECGDGCDFLDLASFVNLVTPQRRYSLNGIITYDILPEHQFRIETKYVNSEASGTGQPHFNFFNLSLAADNAFLPSGLQTILTNNAISSFNVNRFNTDAGLRGQENERQTSRIATGLSGALSDGWDYSVSYLYGRTTSNQVDTFNRINERFFASADAVIDPATGEAVCRHTLDPTSINTSLGRPLDAGIVGDCVPTSLIGEGAVSAAAIDYFSTQANRNAKIDQTSVQAVVNGNLFELPGGAAGFAGGFEYRKESSQDLPDALNRLGLTFGNVLQPESGDYQVRELFGEVSLPVLSSLVVDAAVRFSDYSTIGNTFTWKSGVEWSPLETLRFRGTYSEAVRAPNIGELFGPQNQTFFNVLDPCSEDRLDLGRNGRDVRENNCRALGIPVGFDAQDQTTREGLQGGNPGLREEESDSVTVGLIWTPTESIALAVDYWNIQIDDAISVASATDILNRCVDSVSGIDNDFCEAITRDGTNNISLIRRLSQNIAALEASGVDLEGSYTTELFGNPFRTRVIATFVDKLDSFPFQSDPESREEDAGGLGDPELSGQIDISYAVSGFELNWSSRYIESQLRIDLEDFAVNPDAQSPISTGDVWYHDLNARYDIGDRLTLSAGIDNLFDEDVPFGLTGTGGGSGIFDAVGRFGYVGASLSFGE